jgi:predicted Fe-Mo cluster-binding NifX family protein
MYRFGQIGKGGAVMKAELNVHKAELNVHKIVVTSYGETLSSKVDKSFGRANWFIVFDDQTGSFEAHSNSQNVNAAQGAGTQAGQNVAELGADVLLTGNVGPNAMKTLHAASVRVFAVKGEMTVEEAIAQWKEGGLEEVAETTFAGKWV